MILRRHCIHWEVNITGDGLQNLGFWPWTMARRDLYRATPDLAQDLGVCGLIREPSYCAALGDKQGILRTYFNLGSNGINKVVKELQRHRSECKYEDERLIFLHTMIILLSFYHSFTTASKEIFEMLALHSPFFLFYFEIFFVSRTLRSPYPSTLWRPHYSWQIIGLS